MTANLEVRLGEVLLDIIHYKDENAYIVFRWPKDGWDYIQNIGLQDAIGTLVKTIPFAMRDKVVISEQKELQCTN